MTPQSPPPVEPSTVLPALLSRVPAAARFRLKLGQPAHGLRYLRVSFDHHFKLPLLFRCDAVISAAVGETIDYGSLFAYCFRRFGYPNQGWDDYKELTSYLLTTPHPKLFLGIVPYVGGSSDISLRFYLEEAEHRAIEAYDRRDRDAWLVRAYDYAEQKGLPDWMPAWLAFCEKETGAAVASWRATVPWMWAASSYPDKEVGPQVAAFREQLHTDYAAVEPQPPLYERTIEQTEWLPDDPLKPYVEAALQALRDLHRPVNVRDCFINAFGQVEAERGAAQPAAVSGYPSGALANGAPALFAELHSLVVRLGEGDAKKGLTKAIKQLRDLVPAKAAKTEEKA